MNFIFVLSGKVPVHTHTTPWYYLTTNTYWQCPCTQWTASTSRLITLDTGTNCSNFVKARCPLFSALQRTCKTWPDRVACRVHTRGTTKRNIADVSPVVPELQEIVIVIIDIVAAMCSCNHFGCLHVCLQLADSASSNARTHTSDL